MKSPGKFVSEDEEVFLIFLELREIQHYDLERVSPLFCWCFGQCWLHLSGVLASEARFDVILKFLLHPYEVDGLGCFLEHPGYTFV